MQVRWYVKYREYGSKDAEVVRSFDSAEDADSFKSRLMNGGGGLFGQFHEVYISNRPGRRVIEDEYNVW